MKKAQVFLFTFLFFTTINLFSQIRVGGGVSVDVSIDLPFPEVVVVSRKPSPKVHRAPRPNRPVIHTCDHSCNHNDIYSFGEIQHQNGPQGYYVYQVADAVLNSLHNGNERILYTLDTGEVLEMIISTMYPNDYNYHYSRRSGGNEILAVFLNGREIRLRDGSLSLQPQGNQGFQSVINLHTMREGNFNGTINF